ADLRVGVGRDVLLEEVDETAFALQEREQLERGVGRRLLQHDGRGGRLLFGLFLRLLFLRRRQRELALAELQHSGGEARIEEHAEVRDPGEEEAREEGGRRGIAHGEAPWAARIRSTLTRGGEFPAIGRGEHDPRAGLILGSVRLHLRFPPPGFFLNDPRLVVTLDSRTLYDGSFRSGF